MCEVAFRGDITNLITIKNNLVLDKSDTHHHHLRNPSSAEIHYNHDILQVTPVNSIKSLGYIKFQNNITYFSFVLTTHKMENFKG